MNKFGFHTILHLLVVLLFLPSCKSEPEREGEETDNFTEFTEKSQLDPVWKLETELTNKVAHVFGEVRCQAKALPALDFLERKKETIDPEDKEDLKKETVILLEFASLKQSKADVLELEQCKMEYEKAIEYLSFGIESDLHVEQQGKVFYPSGIQYEREFNISSQKRVLCFFNGIDLEQEFKLIHNDRLLGAGIVKYKFKNKQYLEKQAL